MARASMHPIISFQHVACMMLAFDTSSFGQVVLNELAGSTAYGPCDKDWAEFRNVGQQSADLSGYAFARSKDGQRRFLANFSSPDCPAPLIEPNGYFVLCFADERSDESAPCVFGLPVVWDLYYELFDSSNQLVSSTFLPSKPSEWTGGQTEISWAQIPDVSNMSWRFSGHATPGKKNSNCKVGDKCKDCLSPGTYNILRHRCECPRGTNFNSSPPVIFQCPPCLAGTHNNKRHKTCEPCPSGKYSSGLGATECLSCRKSTFASKGSTMCESCPSGRFSDMVGSGNISSCFCVKGTYGRTATLSSTDCTDCGILYTSEDEVAVSKDDCTMKIEFQILQFVLVSLLVSGVSVGVISHIYHLSARRRKRRETWTLVTECIKCITNLQYPLTLMTAKDFLALGELRRFEYCLARGLLLFLHTLDSIKSFKKTKYYIFFSHQWVGYWQPDPDQKQYACMVQALQSLLAEQDWDENDVYVWLDFFSIPQIIDSTKQSAIHSLPLYAAHASAFVIIAPAITHHDSGGICNADSYQRRLWCRAEQISHFAGSGTGNMYIHNGDLFQQVSASWVRDSLFVFEGECTCCRLQHKGMQLCDKQQLVRPILGLYIAVLLKSSELLDLESDHWEPIHNFMTSNEVRLFPDSFTTIFATQQHSDMVEACKSLGHSAVHGKNRRQDSFVEALSKDASGERSGHVTGKSKTQQLFPKDLLRAVHSHVPQLIGIVHSLASHSGGEYHDDYYCNDPADLTGMPDAKPCITADMPKVQTIAVQEVQTEADDLDHDVVHREADDPDHDISRGHVFPTFKLKL